MEFLSRTAFRLHRIKMRQPLLMIEGKLGFLGCGHLDMGICEDNGDAVAVVNQTKCFEDMLSSKVVDVTSAGQELGIQVGMSGREAVKRLCLPWELR